MHRHTPRVHTNLGASCGGFLHTQISGPGGATYNSPDRRPATVWSRFMHVHSHRPRIMSSSTCTYRHRVRQRGRPRGCEEGREMLRPSMPPTLHMLHLPPHLRRNNCNIPADTITMWKRVQRHGCCAGGCRKVPRLQVPFRYVPPIHTLMYRSHVTISVHRQTARS